QLAGLEAIAEKAKLASQRQGIVAWAGYITVTCRAGTREDALPYPIEDSLPELLPVNRKEQDSDTGPAIRRLLASQNLVNPRLRIAAYDRGPVAGCCLGSNLRPLCRFGRDDERTGSHGKRLGKGVLDLDTVNGQQLSALLPGSSQESTLRSC